MPLGSSSAFDEVRMRRRIEKCIKQVSLILEANRTMATPDKVTHEYSDKYSLANFVTNSAAAVDLNCLASLGLTEEKLKQVTEWAQDRDVSMRFEGEETCHFIKEVTREIEKPTRREDTMAGVRAFTFTSKTFEKVKEYHFEYRMKYKLTVAKGVGANVADILLLQGREGTQTIVQRSNSAPFVDRCTTAHDVNISWLIRNLDIGSIGLKFSINRERDDCYTPRRNMDVDRALKYFTDLNEFAGNVSDYFNNTIFSAEKLYRDEKKVPMAYEDINTEGLFMPVLPLFEDTAGESLTIKDSGNAGGNGDAGMVENASTGDADPSSTSANQSAPPLTPGSVAPRVDLVNAFIGESSRTLLAKYQEMRTAFPVAEGPASGNVTSCEAIICVTMKYLKEVCICYNDCVDYIEDLLRKQIVSAIGKSLTAADFGAYMRFHYRKIFRALYEPTPFSFAVRRSPAHSPEGLLKIDEKTVMDTIPNPIFTLCSTQTAEASVPMSFTLSASTKVLFRGERHLHAWLGHKFSDERNPQLSLVAQARQFSGFIVLIGRIASGTVFEPKYGMIVQNKDELSIPLDLETIPSPKEFKDAIKSLSPEQQRFCQAYRNMQLESTLFGVCVIQIKPQLEKVLNLMPDSLTKEIELTQQLMELFIKYQIPGDLLSFDGPDTADSATRLTNVKAHVEAINNVIKQEKDKELAEKKQQMQFEQASDTFTAEPRGLRGFGAPRSGLAFGSELQSKSVRSKGMGGGMFGGGMMGVPSPPLAMMAMALESATLPPSTPAPPASAPAPAPGTASVNPANQSLSDASAAQYGNVEPETTTTDFTKYPAILDEKYEALDPDNAIRPTIINVGSTWTKKSQEALLSSRKESSILKEKQTEFKDASFDLLDALSKSGALVIDCASLHIVIAATHGFDKSLMDTVVQKNINPIERVERSALIMASTIHDIPAHKILADEQVARVADSSPMLFLEG